MKMRLRYLLLLLCIGHWTQAQVKIGDNPQNLDPASILELESTSRALVISRVTTTQMNAITPLRGAMVYNTDADCLYYYNGTNWINLCEASGGPFTFTTDPVVNPISTIAITQTGNNYNFEVGEITGNNIVNGSINGFSDIQDGTISSSKLQDRAVGPSKLEEGAVSSFEIEDQSILTLDIAPEGPNQVLATNSNGTVQWQDKGSLTAITDQVTITGAGTASDRLKVSDALTTAIANNTTDITAHIAADGDTDPTNEIQTLSEVLAQGAAANGRITNLTNPAAPQDAATRAYVDNVVGGGSQNASQVPFTQTGNTQSNNVQDAIVELQTDINGFGASAGQTNTVSNEGVGGVGVYLTKTGANLEFKNINAGSDKIIVTDDVGNNEIDIDVNETNLNITSAQIQDGTISTLDIADNAVITTNISDANVTPTKIEPSATEGQVLTTQAGGVVWAAAPAGAVTADGATISGNGMMGNPLLVPTDGITTTQIAEGAITSVDIATDAVTTDNILDANVTPTKIQPSVTDGQVLTTQAGAVLWDEAPSPFPLASPAGALFFSDGASGLTYNTGLSWNPNVLEVLGDIHATGDISSTTYTTIPDYVFETYFKGSSELNKEYRFKTLAEIEAFVKENHHLPGILSAEEVKALGQWNLTQASVNNLEKIEELYLHIIEQQKEIEQLKADRDSLSQEVKAIKREMEEIKGMLENRIKKQ